MWRNLELAVGSGLARPAGWLTHVAYQSSTIWGLLLQVERGVRDPRVDQGGVGRVVGVAQLRAYAKRQPGCRALMRHYGIGPLTAVPIVAELGDARRFSSSREAVRYSGLDITVHQSDARRAPGRLSRQGSSALRWALFEAAQCARRPSSPEHDYYQQTAARLGGNRACLAVARKLLKRSYHTLRELGEEGLQPA